HQVGDRPAIGSRQVGSVSRRQYGRVFRPAARVCTAAFHKPTLAGPVTAHLESLDGSYFQDVIARKQILNLRRPDINLISHFSNQIQAARPSSLCDRTGLVTLLVWPAALSTASFDC